MKLFFTIISFIVCLSFSGVAQTNVHPTIATFSLSIEEGNTQISSNSDTASTVTFFIVLKNTTDVNKIYVRISSGQQTSGNIFTTNYLLNSAPVVDSHNITLFKKENQGVFIRTIINGSTSGKNYEICTENTQGQKSSYLSRLK